MATGGRSVDELLFDFDPIAEHNPPKPLLARETRPKRYHPVDTDIQFASPIVTRTHDSDVIDSLPADSQVRDSGYEGSFEAKRLEARRRASTPKSRLDLLVDLSDMDKVQEGSREAEALGDEIRTEMAITNERIDTLCTMVNRVLQNSQSEILATIASKASESKPENAYGEGEHESKSASRVSRSQTIVKANTYDGTEPFQDYMTHFEQCTKINNWDKAEKGLHLAACLRGGALQVLTDLNNKPGAMKFKKLRNALEARFAPPNQTELYKVQLHGRFRKRGETLPELGQVIQRLVSLAYPGCPSDIQDQLGKDQFLTAIHNEDLRQEIWRNHPSGLQEAIRVGVEWEAFKQVGQKHRTVNSASDIDGQDEAIFGEKIDSLERQNKELRDQLERIMEEGRKRGEEQRAAERKERRERYQSYRLSRSQVQCWNCSEYGHYSNECSKPPVRQNNRRGRQGQATTASTTSNSRRQTDNSRPVRYVNEEPGMYTPCYINGIELALLIDTGAAVSILSKRRYDALGRRKPKLNKLTSHIVSASSDDIKTYGQAEFVVAWQGVRRRHKFIVAEIRPDGMLGLDFYHQYGCDISITEQKLIMQGQYLPCYFAGSMGCHRVTLMENIEVPAGTEVVVKGWMPNIGCGKLTPEVILEPLTTLQQETQIRVARVTARSNNGEVPIRLANLTKESIALQKGIICAEASSVILSQPMEKVSVESSKDLPPHLRDLYEQACSQLTVEQAVALKEQLAEFSGVFAKNDNDMGRTEVIKHCIKTGNATPVRLPPRRLPFHARQEVDKQLDEMLERGVVEPSVSPWAAPVVLVTKKDGKKRFCVDYRSLNAATEKDAYPLPRIDDSLDSLAGMSWFTTLDLMSGYWQVEVEEKDRPKTAFVTRRGLHQFRVMPFGLCNAPGTFERLMEAVLAGLQYEICLIYLDDIVIFGSSFEQLLERQAQVFSCLQNAGLKLKASKCTVCARKVQYLGHVISAHGIATDPAKVAAVKGWPTPRSVTAVRRFLGFCGYYRRFINNFAKIASPLHQLTKKNVQYRWTPEHESAFASLREALVTAPVLAIPDFNYPFILDTDASGEAIGAVLSQEIDGKERVVAYASRCLSSAERRYCVTRRELLAVVNFVRHFKAYLYGRSFRVRTDHGSLRWLMSFKEPEGQLARWLEQLSQYNFTIEHRAGARHINADGLSRLPCDGCAYCQRQTLKVSAVWLDSGIDFGEIQRQDPILSRVIDWIEKDKRPSWEEVAGDGAELKAYWGSFNVLELSSRVLMRTWLDRSGRPERKFVVVPHGWRQEVLRQCHDEISGGHLGGEKTLSKVRQRYYWPGMKREVKDYCATCAVCAQHKNPNPKPRAKLQNVTAGEVGEVVGIDILGPLTRTEQGNAYILVIGDYFSKWIEAVALPNIEAVTVAKALIENYISRFGVPRVLHSDQGSQFESAVFQELCLLLGIRKTRTSPYHPQCNGMVERYNRTLCQMLASYVEDEPETWDQYLSLTSMAYRASEHSSTGYTPNQLMLGREVNLPTDLLVGKSPSETTDDLPKFVSGCRDAMHVINAKARQKLGASFQQQKATYDLKVRGQSHREGDLVWLHSTLRKKGKSPKLQVKWTGPWKVIKRITDVTYLITCRGRRTTQIVHFNRLKPCRTRPEERNSVESSDDSSDSEEEINEGWDILPYPIESQRTRLVQERRLRRGPKAPTVQHYSSENESDVEPDSITSQRDKLLRRRRLLRRQSQYLN